MKIAIISDIHGNLEALKATIADIKKKKADKIICLGDIIVKGNHSAECLKIIQESCDVVVQGNCDRYFSKLDHDFETLPEIEQKRIKWNQSLLSEEMLNYLRELPFCYEFYMSGSLVRVFHATPEQDNVAVINFDSVETKNKMFQPSSKTVSDKKADIVIYGHIHHPYMDKLYNRTLINVGSVGNSFDAIRNPEKDANVLQTTQSNYLLIEGEFGKEEYGDSISFQFIKVPYDIDKELSSETQNPEKDEYIYQLKKGMYGDMRKIYSGYEKLGIDITKI